MGYGRKRRSDASFSIPPNHHTRGPVLDCRSMVAYVRDGCNVVVWRLTLQPVPAGAAPVWRRKISEAVTAGGENGEAPNTLLGTSCEQILEAMKLWVDAVRSIP